MRVTAKIFLYYCTLFAIFLGLSGFLSSRTAFGLATQGLFLPVLAYFLFASIAALRKRSLDVTFEQKRLHIVIALILFIILISISLTNILS